MGRRIQTEPNTHARAHPLDPDANPWERQPGESSKAWQAFLKFRDSEERHVRSIGGSAMDWSREWSWGYRCFEYDRYLDRVDVEALVRYRRTMNKRHRDIAMAAQGKIVQYLQRMDVKDMKPSDLARWLEVAIKVERQAAGAELPDGTTVHEPPASTTGALTVADLLGVSDDPGEQADLARELHALVMASKASGNGHGDGG